MRNISFFLTQEAIKARTKTVTRRLGWKNLKPGTLLQGVVKGQGIKKGEKVQKLAVIRVKSAQQEPLWHITSQDVFLEGFPFGGASGFVQMFLKSHKGCTLNTIVTRIEFEYVDQ